MHLHPILIPGTAPDLRFQPLPAGTARGGALCLILTIPEHPLITAFTTANRTTLDRLGQLGLDVCPEEDTTTPHALGLVLYDGPCIVPTIANNGHNGGRAVVTRDAYGFLTANATPDAAPKPDHLRLPPLPKDARWWPFLWLRPSTSTHDDLRRLERVRADLNTLQPGFAHPIAPPILGRLA